MQNYNQGKHYRAQGAYGATRKLVLAEFLMVLSTLGDQKLRCPGCCGTLISSVSGASAQGLPGVPFPTCHDNQNVSKCSHMSPGGENCPLAKTCYSRGDDKECHLLYVGAHDVLYDGAELTQHFLYARQGLSALPLPPPS